MGKLVCDGAQLKCSFGNAPCPLKVMPLNKVTRGVASPVATIKDNIPAINILPFGMCTSPSNPAVIAALGAPSSCVPVTTDPWTPGSPKVLVANTPALNDSSKLMCKYNGLIEVSKPGQETIEVP